MTTVSKPLAPGAAPPSPSAVARPDKITLACFAGVVLIAGANPVAVRISNRELAPFWGAGVRFAIASILLFAIASAMRLSVPRGPALQGAALFGLLAGFGAYAFVYVGLKHVHASLAAPVMASVPLITFFLAVAHRVERFRWRGLIGGATSVAGIAILSGVGSSSETPVKYLLYVLAAAICAAEGSIMLKKFPHVHPIMVNAIATGIAAVLLLALSFATSEAHGVPHHARTWLALGFLTLFGSVVLFVLFVTVINRWTVTGASYQFVLFPLVAVLLASWLADEPITSSLASGGALVIAGVYIGALSGRRAPHGKESEAVPGPPC
jgi:drug/metabolite transporter (DMT)-like permease